MANNENGVALDAETNNGADVESAEIITVEECGTVRAKEKAVAERITPTDASAYPMNPTFRAVETDTSAPAEELAYEYDEGLDFCPRKDR